MAEENKVPTIHEVIDQLEIDHTVGAYEVLKNFIDSHRKAMIKVVSDQTRLRENLIDSWYPEDNIK